MHARYPDTRLPRRGHVHAHKSQRVHLLAKKIARLENVRRRNPGTKSPQPTLGCDRKAAGLGGSASRSAEMVLSAERTPFTRLASELELNSEATRGRFARMAILCDNRAIV